MWVSNDRLSPPEVWEETAGLLCVCVCVCVCVCMFEGVTGCSLFTYEAISPLSVVLLAESSAEGGSGH